MSQSWSALQGDASLSDVTETAETPISMNAERAAAVSVPSGFGTPTIITDFDSVTGTYADSFDLVSGAFVMPENANVLISYSGRWPNTGSFTGKFVLRVLHNGVVGCTTVAEEDTTLPTDIVQTVSFQIQLAAGDVIRLGVEQDSGGAARNMDQFVANIVRLGTV